MTISLLKDSAVLPSHSNMDYNDIFERDRIIPFNEVRRLIDALKNEDGTPNNREMAATWLCLSGARPCEIENRKITEIKLINKVMVWVWFPRKNQKGVRMETFVSWFWDRFNLYTESAKYSNEDIFGITGESLARYINKNIRKKLGGDWLKKIPQFQKDGKVRYVHKWQLKDLRHNFQTHEWYRGVEKYGHDLSLYRLSKRMKHSAKHITGTHYIESTDSLQCNKYKHLNVGEIIKSISSQKSLFEY